MKTVLRECIVCQSKVKEKLFSKNLCSIVGFENDTFQQKVVICSECGFIYTDPVPSSKELLKYYSNFSNYTNQQRKGQASLESINKYERTFNLIKESFPKDFKGKVLEIGCATGIGLEVFKKRDWEVLGIEPSSEAVEIADELYDIEVLNVFFNKDFNEEIGLFDVVILSHVVEHLLYPDDILSKLKSILKPNAIVYIEVPNMLDPFKSNAYFSFEHLNYFTPNNIKTMLSFYGFETEVYEFENSPNIEPFYPVIGAISKFTNKKTSIINDYKLSKESISNYLKCVESKDEKLQKKLINILSENEKKRVAIWGAGLHTSYILELVDNKFKNIVLLCDNNKNKDGETLRNIPVRYFDDHLELASKIDIIIISSIIYENEIYEQLSPLKKLGIQIYKLYN